MRSALEKTYIDAHLAAPLLLSTERLSSILEAKILYALQQGCFLAKQRTTKQIISFCRQRLRAIDVSYQAQGLLCYTSSGAHFCICEVETRHFWELYVTSWNFDIRHTGVPLRRKQQVLSSRELGDV